MRRVAVLPGSFDPITLGHLDVIARATKLFDELHVVVVHNPGKTALLPIAERVTLIEKALAEAGVHGNIVVTQWSIGLLVDYCTEVGASVLVGVGKEIRDSYGNYIPEVMDAVATSAGGVMGSFTMSITDVSNAFKRKQRSRL
jgi:pantetheine-phosphate adenylyltransferase